MESVEIQVTVSISEGNVTLQEPEGAILKTEESENNKIFTVSKNGKYTFIAIGDGGRKARVTVNVDNIVEKPEIEVTQIEDTSCVVNILNGNKDVTYTYYLNGTGKISNTIETSVKIEGLTKETKYSAYVVLNYNGKIINSDTKEFITTNTTESMGEIVLTTSGFVNCYKKDPITNEVVGRILDKSIPYTTLEKASWGNSYQDLYNIFDGDISTSGAMGAQVTEGYGNLYGIRGGYVRVEEECIGKFLNVYIGDITVKFYTNTYSFIDSFIASANSEKNKIISTQIPQNTGFIEIYYHGPHISGLRCQVTEIFLTDNEITSDQTIEEFFS